MSQSGGKVIASGTYGCIFKPSLECKNTPSTNIKVSKLVEIDALNDEYTNILGYNLKQLDPDKNLFIYPDEPLCELLNLDLNRDKPNECGNIQSSVGRIKEDNKAAKIEEINDKLAIINFPYAGQDLVKYKLEGNRTNKIVQTTKLIKSMLNIFYGIKVLLDNNIVHRDLKPENIVFDGEIIRIIDFGLSLNFDTDKTSFDNKILTQASYRFWPLEYRMVYDLINNNIFTPADTTNPAKVCKIIKKIHNLQKESEYKVISTINPRNDIIDLTNIILKYKLNNKISDSQYYTNVYTHFDIFSLGVILDYIFIRSHKYSLYLSTIIQDSMKALITNMTKGSYDKRIGIKEAALEYKKILIDNNIIEEDELDIIERKFQSYFGE
jgi:serine/threonine protein kinase